MKRSAKIIDSSEAAEADARHHWLKEFAKLAKWIETNVGLRTDEHLTWYTKPESPGLFDHGVTAERVAGLIAQLERVRAHTFAEREVEQ